MHYVQVSVGGASWQRRCFRWLGSVVREVGPQSAWSSVLSVLAMIGLLSIGLSLIGYWPVMNVPVCNRRFVILRRGGGPAPLVCRRSL